MANFGTTFERLELKYLIDEATAGEILRRIQSYCTPDRFNPKTGGGYAIYSLYLDTPSMAFHNAKLRDEPDRFKLRARTYSSTSAVHLEVKRKVLEVIEKTRVSVARDRSEDAASGFGEPLKDNAEQRRLLERFAYLSAVTGAEPKVLVRYEREAYVSDVDYYGRVTFDRRITAQRVSGWDLEGDPKAWVSVDDAWQGDGLHSPLVLELKCESAMPEWMNAVIKDFELSIQGFSKYSFGVEATGCEAQGSVKRASISGRGVYA